MASEHALDPDLFLPEPSPRELKYTIISVDDHLVEPANMFEGRLAKKFADRAPRVIIGDAGHDVWEFDGGHYNATGLQAMAGRRPGTWHLEPFRIEEMRQGCWDIEARVRDMDINGVWASLNFPSGVSGFCGRVFSKCSDLALGYAVTKAWNDWMFEEWYSPHPDRIIPLGITFLGDAALGADEIRRNAARGFRSVTLPERPHKIGFPSLFSGYWDPIIDACVETGTVISLHVGSSGNFEIAPDCPHLVPMSSTMFGVLSMSACSEWLWSGYPQRLPNLEIALSEGGIGWVPMLLDRLDNLVDRSGYGNLWNERPADIVRRNFWFCTLDDPSTIALRHRIGVDHIMLETDYPHGDGTWPDTQAVIERCWGDLPAAELRAMCCENAAALYRHPLPPVVLPR